MKTKTSDIARFGKFEVLPTPITHHHLKTFNIQLPTWTHLVIIWIMHKI